MGTNTRDPDAGYFLSVADFERSILGMVLRWRKVLREVVVCGEAVGGREDGIGKAARASGVQILNSGDKMSV
jgi:hypothetical protein